MPAEDSVFGPWMPKPNATKPDGWCPSSPDLKRKRRKGKKLLSIKDRIRSIGNG